jgi:hypothetical protein
MDLISTNFFIFCMFINSCLKFLKPISLFFLVAITVQTHAQKQLIVLKDETVLLRLYPGDEIIFKLKGSKTLKTTYVNNISDTAVVTHRDTVAFHRIERIYFPQGRFYNKIGAFLVIFGSGLFLIDQANVVIVNGQEPSLDNWVSKVTLTSLAIGIPAMLIKKKSQKLDYRHRLMMVTKGSVFYRPDTRSYISPYLEN